MRTKGLGAGEKGEGRTRRVICGFVMTFVSLPRRGPALTGRTVPSNRSLNKQLLLINLNVNNKRYL